MADHPNMAKANETWDAVRRGELGGLDDFTDDLVVDNGPGAGPWRHLEGKVAFFEFALKFIPFFQGTWHQDGQCVYADDRTTISVVHETGTAPSGDVFDNTAIWVGRLNAEGKTDRIWTTDIDHEACEAFWKRNPVSTD
jgi:hypothetical protein